MNLIDEYILKTSPEDLTHLAAFGGDECYKFWITYLGVMENNERKIFLEKKDNKGWTPLFMAVLGKRCNVVKDFLDIGSEINAIDNQG